MKHLSSLSILLILVGTCHGFTVPRSSAVRTKIRHDEEQVHSSSTKLFYRQVSHDDDDTTTQQIRIRTPPGFDMKEAAAVSGINTGLLKALYLNQALNLGLGTVLAAILLLVFSGPSVFGNLDEILRWTGQGPGIFDFAPTVNRILYGVAGAVPLLAINTFVENSDNRAFANVNFSTIALTISLFGRRKAPHPDFMPDQLQGAEFPTSNALEVLVQSAALATVVGFCEETVFRRLVPAVVSQFYGTDNVLVLLLGSTALFAGGHYQPKVGRQENAVVLSLQLVNGLGFGLIYILSGGDLVPCIVAHAFYDFVTFFKTWWDVNAQMAYADAMYSQPMEQNDKEIRAILRSSPTKMNPETFNVVKRLFFTFDFDKNKTLSLSEVRKGLAYLALETSKRPPPQELIDDLFRETTKDAARPDRLNFAGFLRLLTSLQSMQQRVLALERESEGSNR